MSVLVERGPIKVNGLDYAFAWPCGQTNSGKHIAEVVDDFGEPLPAPWCRQCGLEADRLQWDPTEEQRGDA